jgi:hypothetical protein
MKVEDLQLVTKSDTALAIIDAFSSRERVNRETILDKFKSYLIKKGVSVQSGDFIKFFKDLEEAGVGELEENKFIWYYSLRAIAEQLKYPNKTVKLISLDEILRPSSKKPRGRPKGYSPKKGTVLKSSTQTGSITVNTREFIFLFETDIGTHIPFKFSEAERFKQQYEKLKSSFSQ